MNVVIAILVSVVLSLPGGTVSRLQPNGGSTSSQATDAPTDLKDGVTQDTAEALTADLEAVRESRGWTVTQLAAYERFEAALDAVSAFLSTEYPQAFVGSALADDPTEPPTVYVKGLAPADAHGLATELGVKLVEDQPYSLDEIDARLAIVHEAMLSAGFESVVVSADIEREGAITVVVTAPSGASVDQVLTSIAPEVSQDVTVIVVADPVVEDQGAFGGMQLTDGGAFECTSGWTVRKIANGVRGVTGAGHCAGIDGINHPGVGIHAAVQQLLHVGEWGDVGWYTTGQAEADDFYADEFNNIRDVTGVEPRANIAIGEAICFYGRASNNRNCTLEVENPNVFCGIGAQKLAQMNGDVTDPGDSGGGWSFGGTAYGGHKGNCFGESSFSVADLFDEALGVSVAVD